MQKFYLVALFFLVSCAKNQDADVDFTVISKVPDLHSAYFEFDITISDDRAFTEAGIIISKKNNPTFLSAQEYSNGNPPEYIWKKSDHSGSNHVILIEDLREYTKYYFKPYCVVSGKIQYGKLDSIQTTSPPGISIGPAGGYIIYDDGAGGGIEMALEDIELIDEYSYLRTTFNWGCNGINAPGTSANIGTGQVNTDTIIFYCNDLENGAYLCEQYTHNGFSDWYLPSVNELIAANTAVASLGYGNFTSNYYWSSTEFDSYSAALVFMGGYTTAATYQAKYNSFNVRPFRSF